MAPALYRIQLNRWGYTEEEHRQALELGLFDAVDLQAMRHWIVAEPVCSSHCTGCHNEGRPLYFNAMGLLIRHKCPPGVCPHAVSQLSPLIYNYYDHMLRGQDPNDMVFDHITCTDAGLEWGGMGDNLFRITYEKMPLLEFLRFMLSMTPYIFFPNRRARGQGRALQEAPTTGGPPPTPFMQALPLSPADLEAFLASPNRVKRLQAAEAYRDHRIIVKVTAARACIAGHQVGDEFVIDALGRVQPDGHGICLLALTRIWWRVLLVLERMAAARDGQANFEGPLFDLDLGCYSAGLPLGACGQILMKVEVRPPQ
jgi:uncharacterized repeat protein (TIGR04076 family)